jgi:N-acetylgalactosamine-N,N'-diacetylbacillosaminyl-diphospho-undecaprenol 4-alpha-N-acetylgalactosaminyltransferase
VRSVAKPRLAILINSLRGGGAERVVSLLWPKLADRFEIYVVLLSASDIAFPTPDAEHTRVLEGGESYNWQNIARLPRLARAYRRYLDQHRIDISLSFLNRSNFINCLVKRRGWRGQVVISERAVTSLFYKTGVRKAIGRMLIRSLYPFANAIIPISRGVEHDLRTSYGIAGRYHTIYNPIDIATVRDEFERAPAKPLSQPFTFVCVARFDPQKNHAVLVEAFSQLGDADCRLVLVGHGFEMEAIRRQVREKHLESRVSLVGFQKGPVPFLRQADCFVLSSDFEGLGNVILEALACSLPVISTDCFSGPREILAPDSDFTKQLNDRIEICDYGILTPVRDAGLLATAMRRMMTDVALRDGYARRAAERANAFDVGVISREYGDVLTSIVEPPASGVAPLPRGTAR